MKIQSRLGVTVAGISPGHVAVTVNDGDTVNFTASGTDNQTITAEVIIDPAVDNITVATTNGIYTKLIDEVTYAELAALISGSDLIQGRQYLITDYQTVHTIPGTADTNTGSTEPLIVTAISVNELSPIAYSTTYPDDIIHYSPVNDLSAVPGCTKGHIYRRIDTKKNVDISFDYRAVKFRRYLLNVTNTWDIGTTYDRNDVVIHSGNLYISSYNSNLGTTPSANSGAWGLLYFTNASYASHSATQLSIGDSSIPVVIPVSTACLLYTSRCV